MPPVPHNHSRGLPSLTSLMAGLLLPAGLPLSAWGADQCKPFPDTAWLTDFAIPSFSAAIDPDAPNGTVLHSQYVVLNGKSVSFDCSEVPGRLQSYLYGRLEPIGANGTWPTSVNGIGVKIRQTEGDTRQWPIFRAMDPNVTLVSFLPNPVIIEFVKTGAIPLNGGSLTMIGELAGIWIRNNTQQVVSYRIAGGITIKPKPPVCTVTSPSPIAFGSMSAHSFPASVGATTPEKSLTIRVSCTGAAHGGKTRIYMTLTDVKNPSNRGDRLTLSPANGKPAAKGVALQILNNGTPVKYGPDSRAPNNPNNWFVRETGNTTFEIPLTARYIRTAGELVPGSANALATFTMSYQ